MISLAGNNAVTVERLGTVDIHQLGARLRAIPSGSSDDDEAVERVVRLVGDLLNAFGVAYFSRDSGGRLTARPRHCTPPHLGQLPSLVQQLLRLSVVACGEARPQAAWAEIDSPLFMVAVPIGLEYSGDEAIGAIISASNQTASNLLASVAQDLQLIAAFVSQWKGQLDRSQTQTRCEQLTGLFDTISMAAAEEDIAACSHMLSAGIHRMLGCEMVAIGIRRDGRQCRLAGVSADKEFDKQSEVAQDLEELMNESFLHGVKPGEPDASAVPSNTSAHHRLQAWAGSKSISCYPLQAGNAQHSGALVVFADEGPLGNFKTRELIIRATQMAGILLNSIALGQPNRLKRVVTTVAGTQSVLRQRLFWAIVVLSLALLALPLPYRVSCTCQVQPVQRRYIVVPYEGRLETAVVEPGDLVESGQMLARMDGREIEWERGTLEADLKRAEKDHDSALATHDTARAQMARLEAERLRLKIRLLDERLKNIDIKSPIAGIVIGGDPKESVGARLTMGQTILEVGPLHEMVVELAVPDEDVSHVDRGQRVRCRLAAHPLRTYVGTIDRIHPRSETRDTANVFIAEVKLGNGDASLRPGMEGTAKILTSRHMLGWNLFHKAWDALLFRFGW